MVNDCEISLKKSCFLTANSKNWKQSLVNLVNDNILLYFVKFRFLRKAEFCKIFVNKKKYRGNFRATILSLCSGNEGIA